MHAVLLAIDWEPWLRGVLTVVLGAIVWMGSVYLILSTNLGARLGFLVAFAGFFGWMALMGAIWWVYGIGYLGAAPSWQPVPGRTVIQEVNLLHEAGVVDTQVDATASDPAEQQSEAAREAFEADGWIALDPAAPEFGQAVTSAQEFIGEEQVFEPGTFAPVAVYEINPPEQSAYPKFGPNGEFDQLAFFHPPYYTVVEVAPLVPVYTEEGRAPVPPEVDNTRQRQYVYMVRDLGSLRQPAAYICISSTMIFLLACWLLHRRDQIVAINLSKPVPTGA